MLHIKELQHANQGPNRLYSKESRTAAEQHDNRTPSESEASTDGINSSLILHTPGSSVSGSSLRAAATLPASYAQAASIMCADPARDADQGNFVGLEALHQVPRHTSRRKSELA